MQSTETCQQADMKNKWSQKFELNTRQVDTGASLIRGMTEAGRSEPEISFTARCEVLNLAEMPLAPLHCTPEGCFLGIRCSLSGRR